MGVSDGRLLMPVCLWMSPEHNVGEAVEGRRLRVFLPSRTFSAKVKVLYIISCFYKRELGWSGASSALPPSARLSGPVCAPPMP